MTDIKPVAWMTDDGRVVLTKTQEGMPSAAKISYNLPLYPESALTQAREEARREGMREAAESGKIISAWWSMVLAGREIDGDEPLKDSDVILHYSGCGASCMVTAKQLNEFCQAITRAAEGK